MWTMLWTDAWKKNRFAEIMQSTVVFVRPKTTPDPDHLRISLSRDDHPSGDCQRWPARTGVIGRGSLLRWFTNWVTNHEAAPCRSRCPTSPVPYGHTMTAAACRRPLVELAKTVVAAIEPRMNQKDRFRRSSKELAKMQELMHDLADVLAMTSIRSSALPEGHYRSAAQRRVWSRQASPTLRRWKKILGRSWLNPGALLRRCKPKGAFALAASPDRGQKIRSELGSRSIY